jgi:carboxylesterase type B
MVFVHGGGFISGTGQAALSEGASFARDGIVLVTLNYRLGVPGWLALPDAPAIAACSTLSPRYAGWPPTSMPSAVTPHV